MRVIAIGSDHAEFYRAERHLRRLKKIGQIEDDAAEQARGINREFVAKDQHLSCS